MSAQINTDAEFAYGAGYMNPLAALKPRLVYDAVEVDYVTFLCQGGYNTKNIRTITGDNSSRCYHHNKQANDLNYPAFVIPTLRNKPIYITFNRIVTNVGSAKSRMSGHVMFIIWEYDGCSDLDILSTFEAAIADGVDIITVSTGLIHPEELSKILLLSVPFMP
ncbi:hypothetical protein L1887_13866 [Cichorium endivia]|nr:hypothetical protein L1887_13866 [Cichorium endivia]